MNDTAPDKAPTPPPPEQPDGEEHLIEPGHSRFWAVLKVLNVRLRFIFLMVLVGVMASQWENITNHVDRWRHPGAASMPTAAAAEQVEYFCPMHPNVIRSEPGNCPICGMPLSKRIKREAAATPAGVLAQVQLTPLKMQMGRIGTTPIEYRLLTRETRTVGIIEYNETRRATISARFRGRLDKLNVNYIGQHVNKGETLAMMYSPELLVAQQELLTALRSAGANSNGPAAAVAGNALADAARRKLTLWGLTPEQIDAIVQRGTVETDVAITSPIAGIVTEKKALEGRYVSEGEELYTIADLGSVWLQAKVFESDIAAVHNGQSVEIHSTAYPNEIFAGRVTFASYEVDPLTRTISARVEVENPEYKLRPGMYATAIIRLPAGKVEYLDEASTQPAASQSVAASQPSSMPSVENVAAMPLAHAYLKVSELFAADKADAAALAALAEQARALAGQSPQAAQIAKLADEMRGKDIESQRELFKGLSQEMIHLLKAAPMAGMTLYVAHCPMVEADWVTADKEIRNPYAGSQMLTCGSITGELSPSAASARRDEAEYVVGYYCPLTPSLLLEKPGKCPLEGMPTRLARVEKVPAVPELAVIDTGLRKIVYVEHEPGTFWMVEVKLAPRAGEFFPVLEGLKVGDKVATAGAFLVDAENRLNPAIAAQYSGASGGPSAGKSAPAAGMPGMPGMEMPKP